MAEFKYKYDDLFNPTLQAIHNLGGSASITEIENEVAKILKLSDEEMNDIHRGSITKLTYRLAWARTFLKKYGLLVNSTRGIWALSPIGTNTKTVDKNEVNKKVKVYHGETAERTEQEEHAGDDEIETIDWQEKLLNIVQNILPVQFEKLSQRMLRELGFVNVEVTGKSGDGGIDGKGVLRIGGVVSFHVFFQCKRYKGNVDSPAIRDFRGAMAGRADKGLFITTGNFTQAAKREAQREGTSPIDLIDGIELTEKLKELNLGVTIEKIEVEKVNVSEDWFGSI